MKEISSTWPPRILLASVLFAVFGGALALRLPLLDNRPMHADEAVQAARFRSLWISGTYAYDPDEFHGPTLMVATLPAVWRGAKDFGDTDERTFRMVPAVFGAALVLLMWWLRDALGKPAAAASGLMLALSPALVFYSRYYIHETLLVFFTLTMLAAAWRYWASGKLGWALATGAAVGLMQATKETSVLTFSAAIAGMTLTAIWRRLLREPVAAPAGGFRTGHLLAAIAAAGVVAGLLFSSFFANPRGPLDAVLTYLPWLGRAAGESPHLQPWDYYLRILIGSRAADGRLWSEGVILALAAIGGLVALLPAAWRLLPQRSVAFVRCLAFGTLALTAAYSLIPYKTPWCLLSFLLGMILLAGVGAASWMHWFPLGIAKLAAAAFVSIRKHAGRALPVDSATWVLMPWFLWPMRVFAAGVLAAATLPLGWQAYRASFVAYADSDNPYVYVPTLPAVAKFETDIGQLLDVYQGQDQPQAAVVWHDAYYWPIPWYLRSAESVGYWMDPEQFAAAVQGVPPPPIVICSPQRDAAVTRVLDKSHVMIGFYGIRSNVLALVWVRMDLWEAHLRRLGRI